MYRKIFRVLSLVLVLAVAFSAIGSASAQPSLKFKRGGQVEESPNGVYIIQMINDPVVSYKGGIKGLKATKSENGRKIDPNSSAAVDYVAYLDSKHNDALDKVGGGDKLYDYHYSFNGFAARLNLDQANKLASMDDVLVVSPDVLNTMDTSSTPTFLGLDVPGGLWDQLGGFGSAGDGIIIGVIDSGIWPESLSFSDRTGENGNATKDGKLDYHQIPGWHGKCTPGEEFNASMCNQKLIGAQWFNAAWGGDAAVESQRPWEFMSARDYNGHGTHTSSTAGGNHGVAATGPAAAFGSISGMAPHARISMYKALWSTQDGSTASGFNSDLVEAIDQAVADGVDVINYSISGTLTNFLDPVSVSFLFAADAGVFVAASAGNSGPTTSTVAHPGPWLTTVAAGTHNRNGEGSVTLGNGVTYFGASLAVAVGPAPLVNSTAAGLLGADANLVRQCFSGTLDPAVVSGKIVVCERGGLAPNNARVDKSLAVQIAGGVGMILINVTPNSLNADFHSVPTVHLQNTDLVAVETYAATAGATATINQATVVFNTPAPFTASFSSRGPLQAGGGDLLKPDVIAPGQDILAAVSPSIAGRDFDLFSGTSMSSPHVAGVAALLKDLHPDWSPMMIKSALMTTGYDVLDAVDTPTKIFRQGAGHIAPNNAADPGLVYDAGFNDWLAFLCGTGQLTASYCPSIAIDPSNLNVASIAIGDLPGLQTVTRKVTNVGGNETYTFSYSGLADITVTPSVGSFTINPGATQSYNVTFTTSGAALNSYVGGFITWTGNHGHVVRIPVVVRPVALGAPASVSGTGGPINYNVTFGYNGPFTASARGLIPAAITAGTVADDPTDSTCSLASPNAVLVPVTIAAGTTYARFSLFDADVNPGSDIDLCVFRGTSLVGSSGSGTSAEEVNLLNPTAAAYTVVVQGWGVAGSSPFKLHTWVLGSTAAGNMTVTAPASAILGTTGTITLTFTGLAPATKYLGSVAYSGIAGLPNPTIVRVNTP
jgi:subtilisin family serine protease